MIDTTKLEHKCEIFSSYFDRDPEVDLRIRSFNGSWLFHKFEYASEKWVYDGEAQYEGEILTVFDLIINYCPYCGLLLNTQLAHSISETELCKDINEHKCSEIHSYNQKFLKVSFSFDTDAIWKVCHDDECWYLEKHSIATERMVDAEVADRDEMVLWFGTSIKFCPFCGKEL